MDVTRRDGSVWRPALLVLHAARGPGVVVLPTDRTARDVRGTAS